jgi:hypothetical protein
VFAKAPSTALTPANVVITDWGRPNDVDVFKSPTQNVRRTSTVVHDLLKSVIDEYADDKVGLYQRPTRDQVTPILKIPRSRY